jgi:hypothetical protein
MIVATIFLAAMPCQVQAQQQAPEIKGVRGYERRAARKPGTATFRVVLEGRHFGAQPGKIKVKLEPAEGIVEQPRVLAIRERGAVVLISWVAAEGYAVRSVALTVDKAASQSFDLAKALEELFRAQAAEGPEPEAEPSMQKQFIRVYRSLLDPKVVSDTFGKRIAKRFVVVQVTIINRSKDFQFLLQDISIRFSKALTGLDPEFELSSNELSMLRGVAERGQSMGWRNLTIRILRGIGSVAAALSGIMSFHDFYSPSVAAFSGPTLTAVTDIFPDFTIGQMNRLNDSAYLTNTVIPKQQARVVAVFIPQRLFLTPDQQEKFWDEPTSLWGEFDLRDIEILTDGDFVTEVEDIPAVVTTSTVQAEDLPKLQSAAPEVRGTIVGQFLSGATLSLAPPVPEGLTLETTGTPTDTRLEFILKATQPVPPGTVVHLELKKKNSSTRTSVTLQYTAAVPVLQPPDPPVELAPGSEQEITLAGENFIPGVTQARVSGRGVTAPKLTVNSPTELKLTLRASADAAEGERELFVFQTAGGPPSAPIVIRIKKKLEETKVPKEK